MAAWFLLPAAATAVSAIGKYAAHKANKPIKQKAFRQKANTGYLRKYMSDLQGRSASRARTELAMRPALRAIGAQQAKGQRQLEYQAAQQGLAGSGIEAQKQLALQAGTTQAVAGLGEKIALSAQAKAQQLQAAREGQRMKIMGQIGQKEAAVSEANRAAQFQASERFRQQTLAHNQQSKAIARQGFFDTLGSVASGYGQQEMGKIAADKAKLLTQRSEDFQWDLMNAQNQSSLEKPDYGFQGGGVAGKDMEYYQTGGVAQDSEFVEFLSGSQDYQQALQDYQVQQDAAIQQQRTDKENEFKLYKSKLAQITDIYSKRGEPTKSKTGQLVAKPLPRSKKQLVKKLEQETDAYFTGKTWEDVADFKDNEMVLKEDTTQPYQLTQTDSSKVARDYVSGLFKEGLVSAEGLHKSFTGWKNRKYANLETAVDNKMTDYYEQASEGDVNADEIFTTLRNPNFMKSKNYKAYRTSLLKVLNTQQADKEKIAGATEKTAQKMSSAKMNIVGNLPDMKGFFRRKITDESGAEVWDADAATDKGTAYEEISARIKELIKYQEGGIPFQFGEDDQGSYEMNEKQSYDHIVNEVRKLVDELSVPLSVLQAATTKDQAGMFEALGFEPKNRAMWQVTGGDEKWKRTIVNELTKNLDKPYMWKETVQSKDDPLELGD